MFKKPTECYLYTDKQFKLFIVFVEGTNHHFVPVSETRKVKIYEKEQENK